MTATFTNIMSRYSIEIANQQASLPVDEDSIRLAIEQVLADEQIARATISVAVVDDGTIHQLNVKFLNHDHPTDALSFVLESGDGFLEGEIIISADTATRQAGELGLHAADELLLYAIHGALHLVGYDDVDPQAAQRMRDRERHYLSRFASHPTDARAMTCAPCEE